MERVQLDGALVAGGGAGGSPAYRAVLMRPGEWAGKRLRADPDVVRRAAGLFEGKAGFLNPPPPAAGQHGYPGLQHLLGTVRAARWDEAEQAVVGEYALYPTPAAQWFGQVVDRVLADRAAGRPAPDIGLSAVVRVLCGPAGAGGVRDVREIVGVEQVDAVYRPAAGGEFVQVINAEGGDEMEELTSVQRGSGEGATGAREEERALLLEAALGAAALPAAFERLVRADLPADWSAAQLKGRIQAARDAWAETLRPRTVAGHPQATGMRDSVDQLTEAFAALVEARAPRDAHRLSGVREFYLALSGDYEMAGVFHGERVMLANVTSTTMSSIVANVLNKVVANEFQACPRWWEPICRIESFNTLQQVRWVMLGGVGELPTVDEGAAYTELTWDDAYQTASWVKKGGYLGITLEAMDTDDVGRLRAAPQALARAAWLTLGKSVSAIFTASSGVGPALADGKALFHADHANLGSTALSAASWTAARLAMRQQTELHSGERLGALTSPRYLLVPSELEGTAITLFASEGLPGTPNNDVNPEAEGDGHDARMAAARRRVIVVDLWTDANNWAAVADPRLYPTIGLGFRFGQTPEVFSVASPASGLMFTNDVLPVKVRWFYAAGPMDHRGLYKANVA
jgi:hypothetical protein